MTAFPFINRAEFANQIEKIVVEEPLLFPFLLAGKFKNERPSAPTQSFTCLE
jgi:hypothetical protein